MAGRARWCQRSAPHLGQHVHAPAEAQHVYAPGRIVTICCRNLRQTQSAFLLSTGDVRFLPPLLGSAKGWAGDSAKTPLPSLPAPRL